MTGRTRAHAVAAQCRFLEQLLAEREQRRRWRWSFTSGEHACVERAAVVRRCDPFAPEALNGHRLRLRRASQCLHRMRGGDYVEREKGQAIELLEARLCAQHA